MRQSIISTIIFFGFFFNFLFFQNCSVRFKSLELEKINEFHSVESFNFQKTGVVKRVGNRDYLSNTFKNLFLPEGAEINNCNAQSGRYKNICNIIRGNIYNKPHLYGGLCVFNQGRKSSCAFTTADKPYHALINPAREAGRISTCRKVGAYTEAIQSFVGKLDADINTEIDDEKIQLAFSQFYPGFQAPTEVLEALKGVVSKYSDSRVNQWRYLTITLCESPGWQLF